MAGGDDSVMWLRVEDKDIDAAKLLRVTVNENTTGSGRKRRTSFVCKGTLHKGNEERMEEYGRVQKDKGGPENRRGAPAGAATGHDGELPEAEEGTGGRWSCRLGGGQR